MSNSSIWPINRTLSDATTDGNEGVLPVLLSSSITEALSSDGLMPYLGHLLGKSYL